MKAEFDDKAATWDEDPIRVQRAEVIGNELKSKVELSKIEHAMEYGSGTGLLSFAMKDDLKNVVLMDESAEMTKVAKNKCDALGVSHFRPVQYDLMKDKLPDERYDLIYILLTLHHIIDYESILGKFEKLLSPGGYLVIIDLEKEDGSFHDGEFYGHKGFDKCILRNNLEETGLSPVSYEVCYELEKTNEDGSSRTYPLFMMISRKGSSKN